MAVMGRPVTKIIITTTQVNFVPILSEARIRFVVCDVKIIMPQFQQCQTHFITL